MEPRTPFDLNAAVAAWRRRLLSHPGIWPGDADEMEAHLRDEIQSRTSRGMDVQEAFMETAERIGSPAELSFEFEKARRSGTLFGRTPGRNHGPMLRLLSSYLSVAWRYLRRGKGYAAISL